MLMNSNMYLCSNIHVYEDWIKKVFNRAVTFRSNRVGHRSITNFLRLDDVESITALVMIMLKIRSFEVTYWKVPLGICCILSHPFFTQYGL